MYVCVFVCQLPVYIRLDNVDVIITQSGIHIMGLAEGI